MNNIEKVFNERIYLNFKENDIERLMEFGLLEVGYNYPTTVKIVNNKVVLEVVFNTTVFK